MVEIDDYGRLNLSTGRKLDSFDGIYGISSDGTAFYGYDGNLDAKDWTAEEKQEFAFYMASMWLKWALPN